LPLEVIILHGILNTILAHTQTLSEKSRNGIAVITGKESAKELKQLTDDIFMYYGLGCRNVSHIMIPVDYDFTTLLDTISSNEKVSLNHKYFNNYEYNKAIYLVNGSQHFDTGNLLLIVRK